MIASAPGRQMSAPERPPARFAAGCCPSAACRNGDRRRLPEYRTVKSLIRGLVVAFRPVTAIVGGLLLAASFPDRTRLVSPIAVALLTASTVTAARTVALWLGIRRRVVVLWGPPLVDQRARHRCVDPSRLVLRSLARGSRCRQSPPRTPSVLARLGGRCLGRSGSFEGPNSAWGLPVGPVGLQPARQSHRRTGEVSGAAATTFAVGLSGALLCWAASHHFPVVQRGLVDRSSPAFTCRPADRSGSRRPSALPSPFGLSGRPFHGQLMGESYGGVPSATIALVQGSVPGYGLDAMSQRRAVLNNHVRETKVLGS